MTKPQIIALYLPQYHQIPENNKFWGEGFTDWVTVKKAKPLFDGHDQPRVPLNDNYYDLSEEASVLWQARLAKSYGISAFGVYHYWFNNNSNLLTKPTEIMRDSHELGVKYFLTWDNCSWKRSWSNVKGNDWAPTLDVVPDKNTANGNNPILIPYILGNEQDWEKHYLYAKSHFESENYLIHDGKPLFCIMNYDRQIQKMCDYWQELAQKDGYNGIHFIYKEYKFLNIPHNEFRFNYEPSNSGWNSTTFIQRLRNFIKKRIGLADNMKFYNYDIVWRNLLHHAEVNTDSHLYYGAYVGYDDTPRRGKKRGKVVQGGSPEKFSKYLRRLVEISTAQNKPFIFITAWNEWGEGAYLEPDTKNKYMYLKAVKQALL